MPEGRVVESVGGWQKIVTADGREISCKALGRIKRRQGEIVVGDLVLFREDRDGPVIEEVKPRSNLLTRPLAANVDQALMVFAMRLPEPNLMTLDRFLVAVLSAGLPVVLCFNKIDLVKPKEAEELADYYGKLGFPTVLTSALTRKGRNKLLQCLYGHSTVICGPSGVGKSALINMIQPGAGLATGELSAKIQRGRHTTRAARLIVLPRGGFIVDTPGFTQVDLAGLEARQLLECFPEMEAYAGACRFHGCLHLEEPDCAVKQAVLEGALPAKRYEHYRQFATAAKRR